MPAGPARARVTAISRWPAIGQIPACRQRSKVPFGPATAPPRSSRKISSESRSHLMTSTDTSALEQHIQAATSALLERQKPDGHWVFELEADSTIPAEYILMRHYLAEPVDAELERKIGIYLRRVQGAHGGWPLFHEGAFDMSASVKAYYAL